MPWARRACEGAEGAVASSAEGSQEYLGAPRGVRKPLETVKVLGEGSKTYFIYVLRPSILIKSVWVLHHHGAGSVESLVKNDKGHGGRFAVWMAFVQLYNWLWNIFLASGVALNVRIVFVLIYLAATQNLKAAF